MSINLRESMRMLDMEQGGIFPEAKRSITPNTSCLIVSFGGTGSDALEVLKKNLERNIKKEDLDKYVRILAVDTCSDTQIRKARQQNDDGTIKIEQAKRFSNREFLWLNNVPAKQAIQFYENDNSMKQWINPELPEVIRTTATMLDGRGASNTRQVGRVLLYPQQTVNELQAKITSLVRDITDGNSNRLEVLIISGIAGGTGSGTVVDATYLIRDCISRMPGGVGNTQDYMGFIFLPPTGMSRDPIKVSKGNRNAIAALKEIDHFMTIGYRGETYSSNLAGRNIVSRENIFKTCYLIDGVCTGYAVTNPREKANEVVSDCILDMLTSQPVNNAPGQNVATVDEFMSDAATDADQMLGRTPADRAPRNANYVYCAIGHGKTLIPLELMKAYVAKTVFDKIYELYRNSGRVGPTDANDFVERVKVRPFNRNAQRGAITAAVDELFADPRRGPYYTINLLNEAAQHAGEKKQEAANRKCFLGIGEDARQEEVAQYDYIRTVVSGLNQEIFEVYTMVLDEMKNYLEDQHGILCDSERLERYCGSTYTFTPIDFGSADVGAQTVRRYLEDLVDDRRVRKMASELISEMAGNREEWTELAGNTPRFNAAARIRRFWADKVGAIVGSTIEDYLLKYYSNDPDAKYEEIMTNNGPQPTQASVQYMNEAARAIVDEMWGRAGVATPFAELKTNDIAMEFVDHNLFLVPQSAPHLRQAIQRELRNRNLQQVNVIESYADDRLSCYSQYTGIPAFMFAWVSRAEQDYERAISSATIGLHMSETKGGERWQDYPNLLVEDIWSYVGNPPPHNNQREHGINQRVTDVFNRARGLGLAQKHALATQAQVGQYTMYTLPAKFRPDVGLFKDVDTELDGSQAKERAEKLLNDAVDEKARQLFGAEAWENIPQLSRNGMMQALEAASVSPVQFASKELHFTHTNMTPGVVPAPDGWEEKLAAELLRTCPSYMFDVRGSVLVMERLFELVSKAQAAKQQIKDFASFLAAELFQYNSDLRVWTYNDEFNVQQVLTVIEYGNREKEDAQYYFMFEDYRNNVGPINNALRPRLKEANPQPQPGATLEDIQNMNARRKVFTDRANDIAQQVSAAIAAANNPNNPNQRRTLTSLAYRTQAQNRGYNVDEILRTYRSLAQQLNIL